MHLIKEAKKQTPVCDLVWSPAIGDGNCLFHSIRQGVSAFNAGFRLLHAPGSFRLRYEKNPVVVKTHEAPATALSLKFPRQATKINWPYEGKSVETFKNDLVDYAASMPNVKTLVPQGMLPLFVDGANVNPTDMKEFKRLAKKSQGGNMMIGAACNKFNININVYRLDPQTKCLVRTLEAGPDMNPKASTDNEPLPTLHLLYSRRGSDKNDDNYTGGAHYDALIPVPCAIQPQEKPNLTGGSPAPVQLDEPSQPDAPSVENENGSYLDTPAALTRTKIPRAELDNWVTELEGHLSCLSKRRQNSIHNQVCARYNNFVTVAQSTLDYLKQLQKGDKTYAGHVHVDDVFAVELYKAAIAAKSCVQLRSDASVEIDSDVSSFVDYTALEAIKAIARIIFVICTLMLVNTPSLLRSRSQQMLSLFTGVKELNGKYSKFNLLEPSQQGCDASPAADGSQFKPGASV